MDGYEDPNVREEEYKGYHEADTESQALLPTTVDSKHQVPSKSPSRTSTSTLSGLLSHPRVQLILAFLAGALTCVLIQVLICSQHWFNSPTSLSSTQSSDSDTVRAQAELDALAQPWAGSTEVHRFPPTSPTNVFPSLFPTHVDPAGPTPTGAEAALVATAPSYPLHTGAPHLVQPTFTKSGDNSSKKDRKFDLFRHWGNLSPWFSVKRGAFGIDSSPDVPDTCRVTGLHLLHRHGARYPTQWCMC